MEHIKNLRNWSALLVGFLFSIGLGISGMTQPQKVIAFLTWGPDWDPSLMFVMLGAVPIHAIVYFSIRNRKSPLFDKQFHLSQATEITKPLMVGSVIFGLGWGLAGYCPGPAVTSVGAGSMSAIIFTFSMLSGMLIYRIFERSKELRKKN
ncbi:YeeE/YedE family protein [Bdellovibrio sp. SKB1291214]|uniref:YeeE/YedE family protein n=1 Tax=Bdellovibrio sp. SKB1291214 TaxID=1732569 RepID=UPI000B516911|nr:YeeE/YedE family protein [Bdellovibrio sp. SKB1291214]UYL09393.1 YeeE/YedE family protein [Bdellovibrio sp. SKB1291214]